MMAEKGGRRYPRRALAAALLASGGAPLVMFPAPLRMTLTLDAPLLCCSGPPLCCGSPLAPTHGGLLDVVLFWRALALGSRLPPVPQGDIVVAGEAARRKTVAWGEAI